MNWLIQTLGSSVGKKLMMAVTGLAFIGFLAGHLAGNLILYCGREAFNDYAEHLHSLGVLLTVVEFGLLFLALIHISTGLLLLVRNLSARPQRYCVNKSAGGRTLGSRTMPYTGIAILAFVVLHLMNFHFADKTGTTIFDIVSNAFQNPVYVALYVIATLLVAVHINHGLWSAFQTLGWNHIKYMPIITVGSLIFAVLVGLGLGFIPIYIAMTA